MQRMAPRGISSPIISISRLRSHLFLTIPQRLTTYPRQLFPLVCQLYTP